ncbi:hypothetical protein DFA_00743 [Cavenderia fasciculata]|uniref:Uncharacterized protein n=1 Tax=Cavenderia fasciculata TaxID=261658 RepID=F4PTJ6_CACFS|nr:uncharacterized protein DFA_00743 [Cavenderia fasciculata]EGG20878.1 hypothetical protein DFA_00743 [Cavenderia fasciculata]|eukprot:XP_004358728.1 hypothetical protein DFA_00743 [Cavenderia fasciculata]
MVVDSLSLSSPSDSFIDLIANLARERERDDRQSMISSDSSVVVNEFEQKYQDDYINKQRDQTLSWLYYLSLDPTTSLMIRDESIYLLDQELIHQIERKLANRSQVIANTISLVDLFNLALGITNNTKVTDALISIIHSIISLGTRFGNLYPEMKKATTESDLDSFQRDTALRIFERCWQPFLDMYDRKFLHLLSGYLTETSLSEFKQRIVNLIDQIVKCQNEQYSSSPFNSFFQIISEIWDHNYNRLHPDPKVLVNRMVSDLGSVGPIFDKEKEVPNSLDVIKLMHPTTHPYLSERVFPILLNLFSTIGFTSMARLYNYFSSIGKCVGWRYFKKYFIQFIHYFKRLSVPSVQRVELVPLILETIMDMGVSNTSIFIPIILKTTCRDNDFSVIDKIPSTLFKHIVPYLDGLLDGLLKRFTITDRPTPTTLASILEVVVAKQGATLRNQDIFHRCTVQELKFCERVGLQGRGKFKMIKDMIKAIKVVPLPIARELIAICDRIDQKMYTKWIDMYELPLDSFNENFGDPSYFNEYGIEPVRDTMTENQQITLDIIASVDCQKELSVQLQVLLSNAHSKLEYILRADITTASVVKVTHSLPLAVAQWYILCDYHGAAKGEGVRGETEATKMYYKQLIPAYAKYFFGLLLKPPKVDSPELAYPFWKIVILIYNESIEKNNNQQQQQQHLKELYQLIDHHIMRSNRLFNITESMTNRFTKLMTSSLDTIISIQSNQPINMNSDNRFQNIQINPNFKEDIKIQFPLLLNDT